MATSTTVFLLPGQGGYRPGILAELDGPDARATVEVIDAVAAEFGRPGVSRLLFDAGAPEAVDLAAADPFSLQLAVFAAAVCWCQSAQKQHRPDILVGHSMGEIAALTVAGAFELADGARLVCHRAQALRTHNPQPGGMLALELNAARTAHLVGALAVPGLALAVCNAPQQSVVSGPEAALQSMAAVAGALNVQAQRLNAPYPFHSPLLALAAQEFNGLTTAIAQRPLRTPVYSPVAGELVSDATDLKALLCRQLTMPVHFLAAVRQLHDGGARTFLECGRAGLAGLVRRTVADVTVRATSTGASAQTEQPRTPAGPVSAAAASASAQVGSVLTQAGPVSAAAGPVTAGSGLAPKPAAEPSAVSAVSVLEQLRQLYATTLGYPPEAITGEADLEADLGIDSLKRAEMSGKVIEHFDLSASEAASRLIMQTTLADLAELVASAQTEQPRTQAGPVSAAAGPVTAGSGLAPKPAAEPSAVSAVSVLEQLRQLYATTLGYPPEAITGEADLEADLGIDSLKRAEMSGKVIEHFDLSASEAASRLIMQTTLADLAELVASAQPAGR